jgi:hypothetical protein
MVYRPLSICDHTFPTDHPTFMYSPFRQVCYLWGFCKSLFTNMFHHKIAILHDKRFLLQSLVTVINTVYIHYLTGSSFVVKIPFKNCPNVTFLRLKIFC